VSGVDAVLFDLDGTLLAYRRSPGEVLAASFERAGVDPLFPVAAYRDRFDEFADRSASMADLRADCFAALADERGHDPALGRAVADAFERERDQSHVALLSGVEAALDALGEAHALGVVTNGPRDAQSTKLRAVGLDERVETVVYAAAETAPKPDPEPFERALEDLGVAPARAVHVGDSASDVAGAANAGLRSVLVGDAAVDPEPTFSVPDAAALVPPPWA
jgi:putative hydrolase of the HAD superfamily